MASRRRTPEENRAIVERELSAIQRHAERSGVFSRLPESMNIPAMHRLFYQGFPISQGRPLSRRQKEARALFLGVVGPERTKEIFDTWKELYATATV